MDDTAEKLTKIKTEAKKIIKGRDDLLDAVILGLASNEHILIKGTTGEAKSMCAEIVAEATGLDFYHQQLHQETRIRDIVGVFNPFPFSKPELFVDEEEIRKNPDKVSELYKHLLMKTDIWNSNIIFFDEIMRARTEFVDFLLEIMQERRISKTILPTEDVPLISVIATTNPLNEDYNTERLDAAIKDRFYSIIDLKPLIEKDQSASRKVIELNQDDIDRVIDNIDITPQELRGFRGEALDKVDYDSFVILSIFKHMKDEGHSFSSRFQRKFRQITQVNALLNGRDKVKNQDIFDVSDLMFSNRFGGLDDHTINEIIDSALIDSEYSQLIDELDKLDKIGNDEKYIDKAIEIMSETDQKYPELPEQVRNMLSEKEDKLKEKMRNNLDELDPDLLGEVDGEKFADIRREFVERNTVRTQILSEREKNDVRKIIQNVNGTCRVIEREDDESGKVYYIVKPKITEPDTFKEAKQLRKRLEDYLPMF